MFICYITCLFKLIKLIIIWDVKGRKCYWYYYPSSQKVTAPVKYWYFSVTCRCQWTLSAGRVNGDCGSDNGGGQGWAHHKTTSLFTSNAAPLATRLLWRHITSKTNPAINAGLMLAQHRRQWANFKPALGYDLVFSCNAIKTKPRDQCCFNVEPT